MSITAVPSPYSSNTSRYQWPPGAPIWEWGMYASLVTNVENRRLYPSHHSVFLSYDCICFSTPASPAPL